MDFDDPEFGFKEEDKPPLKVSSRPKSVHLWSGLSLTPSRPTTSAFSIL